MFFLAVFPIKPVYYKGNQSWIFTGRTDAEAEAPIFWPPDATNWLIGKDPVAGKDWRQEEEGTPEDEMVEWYHWFDGPEFEQAPEVGDGQGGLACCSPQGRKESRHYWAIELNWGWIKDLSHIFCHVCLVSPSFSSTMYTFIKVPVSIQVFQNRV